MSRRPCHRAPNDPGRKLSTVNCTENEGDAPPSSAPPGRARPTPRTPQERPARAPPRATVTCAPSVPALPRSPARRLRGQARRVVRVRRPRLSHDGRRGTPLHSGVRRPARGTWATYAPLALAFFIRPVGPLCSSCRSATAPGGRRFADSGPLPIPVPVPVPVTIPVIVPMSAADHRDRNPARVRHRRHPDTVAAHRPPGGVPARSVGHARPRRAATAAAGGAVAGGAGLAEQKVDRWGSPGVHSAVHPGRTLRPRRRVRVRSRHGLQGRLRAGAGRAPGRLRAGSGRASGKVVAPPRALVSGPGEGFGGTLSSAFHPGLIRWAHDAGDSPRLVSRPRADK